MPVRSHTVKQGETLGGIAQRYGVDLSEITGYSSGNPDLIRTGENLSIGSDGDVTPVNRINANDLGGPSFEAPPTTVNTKASSLTTLADSTRERIDELTPKVEQGEEKIKSIYTQLGDKAVERADAYANEDTAFGNVNVNKAELQKISGKIKQRDLAYRRRIEKIQDTNEEGQLASGQKIQIDKIEREWAREMADLSIVAEVAAGNYEGAKSIIDDRIDAETEDLTTELAGLQYFYSQNYNKLSDEQRTLLQQETAVVSDELDEVRALEEQIGQIQLEAARNGASAETIVSIGRSNNVTDAISTAGSYIGKLERDREARLGSEGSGSGSSTYFSKTQKAKGAAAAGMTLEEFSTLDTDTQNFYINSYGEGQKLVDQAFEEGYDLEGVQAELEGAGLPETGFASLSDYAAQQWDSNYRPLSEEEEYSGMVTALTSYKDQGYSRDEAFDNELKFQTEDEDGKSLGLPEGQVKKIKKNIKDALVDVYGRTFWQSVLPLGR